MKDVRSNPCQSCPYRQDVPSGVWCWEEYEKLREFDLPTSEQPIATFGCHATPEHLCHGWAVVHTSRGHEYDLLGLRVFGYPDIPQPTAALFGSGNEAADHGQAEIEAPGVEALEAVDRLVRKYPRLR